jgi:hypothetical protein
VGSTLSSPGVSLGAAPHRVIDKSSPGFSGAWQAQENALQVLNSTKIDSHRVSEMGSGQTAIGKTVLAVLARYAPAGIEPEEEVLDSAEMSPSGRIRREVLTA